MLTTIAPDERRVAELARGLLKTPDQPRRGRLGGSVAGEEATVRSA